MRLGADLDQAWSHSLRHDGDPHRIVRAVLNEIVVRVRYGYVDLVLHWQGGDHTPAQGEEERKRQHRGRPTRRRTRSSGSWRG